MEYAHDGQIVLNISSRAVDNRVNAVSGFILVQALVAYLVKYECLWLLLLFMRENGAGMMFEPEPAVNLVHHYSLLKMIVKKAI